MLVSLLLHIYIVTVTEDRIDPYAHAPEPIRAENPDDRPHDIPAQDETEDEHKIIPAPVIATISPRDPAKDRTITSTNGETAGTKPIGDNPAINAADAKAQAESHPGAVGSDTAKITGGLESNTAPGETFADPTAKSTNISAPSQTQSKSHPQEENTNTAEKISNAAANTPIGVAGPTTAVPIAQPTVTPASNTTQFPTTSSAQPVTTTTTTTNPAPAFVAPATPTKSAVKPTTVGVGAVPVSDATPVKQINNSTTTAGIGGVGSPSSVASSPAPVHQRQTTGGSDVRKRKSSFFTKVRDSSSSSLTCRPLSSLGNVADEAGL
jgi:hypothetical protein